MANGKNSINANILVYSFAMLLVIASLSPIKLTPESIAWRSLLNILSISVAGNACTLLPRYD
jgi:hypothetical protein